MNFKYGGDYTLPHIERYDKWAPDYNKNVLGERDYAGLNFIVNLLLDVCEKQVPNLLPQTPDLKVMDIGCGTGLVGEVLAQKGYTHIDGVDLSNKMVEEAHKTGAYKSLMGWCDIQQKLPFFFHNQYDITIAAGVFTLDMVTPESLGHLIQITKPGGLIVISTRTEWYDTYQFKDYYEKMIESGHIKLLDCKMDAPYLVGEFDAHYWAFLVENNTV